MYMYKYMYIKAVYMYIYLYTHIDKSYVEPLWLCFYLPVPLHLRRQTSAPTVK